MRKNSYFRYLIAFISIIIISFMLLSWLLTSIFRVYSTSEKDSILRHNASSVADILSQTVDMPLSIGNYTEYLTFQTVDCDIIVTDTQGKVLYPRANVGKVIDIQTETEEYVDTDSGEEYRRAVGTLNGLLSVKSRIYVAGIVKNGQTLGYVLASRSTLAEDALIDITRRTVFTDSVLVMIAVVIAVYFVTERMMRPLREITQATKSYAEGKFETRVAVYGDDEIAELANAFNGMAEALETNEKTRNTFLANISHDLRTPMTTISGFIDGINSGAIPPEKQSYYLNVISAEVHRLSRLVNQILDVSRLESGERKFVFADFDVAEVARLILISFEQKIEEKRLNVMFDSEDTVMVRADKDAIYQVLYNLCHNAIKFSKTEGIFRIRIAAIDAKKVEVSVYDEGQGIPPEDIPMVFERFYKTDKSRGLDKSGVGLGLYICKTIMDAHGESLTVQSGEADCEFKFTLKRKE